MKGIYTAVSGAVAQTQQLDTIANNLANVDTPAFKRDQQVFREFLTAYEKPADVIEAPRDSASIDSMYPLNGADKSYVDSAGTSTNFEQGSLRVTENPFDVAIEGDGFYEVLTSFGVRLTRNGSFTLNKNAELVTKQGYPVLKKETQADMPMAERIVRMGAANTWSVSPKGDMTADGVSLGQLSVVTAKDKDVFQKEGNSLYKLRETINSPVIAATEFKLHQGSMEKSNVNIIREMTDMIQATRTFESTQKAIQAYDSMSGKLVNDVPKLR